MAKFTSALAAGSRKPVPANPCLANKYTAERKTRSLGAIFSTYSPADSFLPTIQTFV